MKSFFEHFRCVRLFRWHRSHLFAIVESLVWIQFRRWPLAFSMKLRNTWKGCKEKQEINLNPKRNCSGWESTLVAAANSTACLIKQTFHCCTIRHCQYRRSSDLSIRFVSGFENENRKLENLIWGQTVSCSTSWWTNQFDCWIEWVMSDLGSGSNPITGEWDPLTYLVALNFSWMACWGKLTDWTCVRPKWRMISFRLAIL